MNVEVLLGRLKKVRHIKHGWMALCPAHNDRNRSLSIGVSQDEKILIKCHAGCAPEDILEELHLKWEDLFPNPLPRKRNGISVKDLALDKCIPEDFLVQLGVVEESNWVRISYYMEDGSLASRQRKRWAVSAKLGSAWEKGEGQIVIYGLWKLHEAREKGFLFFVEGESDAWTLWWYKYPALGIPGASLTKMIEAQHIRDIKQIFIVKEPDQGGQTFVQGIKNRLLDLNYKGLVFVLEMKGAKDPNDLHKLSKNFREDFNKLLENAKPIPLINSKSIRRSRDYGSLIPALPEPEDKQVLDLVRESVNSKEHFVVLAPQGAGKSYANSFIAVQELKKGRSVILSSRSHDELNQMGKTIKNLLQKEDLSEHYLFHLKGIHEDWEDRANRIPDIRPIIIIAPHVYLQFKGETPYHYTLIEMIFQKAFGDFPLLIIDEFPSFLDMSFISKPLGSRESFKKILGEELCVKNMLCPLFTLSGNCLNCNLNMDLVLRRGPAGMPIYVPLSQRNREDKVKREHIDIGNLVDPDKIEEDYTMRVYPLSPTKSLTRQWSRGGKNDPGLPINLQFWFNDVVSRMIEPHIVRFFPYEFSSGNIGRPLTEEELKDKKNGWRVVPPRQVCDVPLLQGWDLAILREVSKYCQIGLTGPEASETDRLVLKQAIGLEKKNYRQAKMPFVTFRKLLIITLEKDLQYKQKETRDLFKSWTQVTKVLSFLPTSFEADQANKDISEEIKTMFYDGTQRIRHAPINGTSINFDLCISYINGPLGQGIDLGQFKITTVSTECERPKCLFAYRNPEKSNKDYIIEDVAERCRQATLRSLRITPEESPDPPRVFLLYGTRYTNDVARRLESALSEVGHVVKVVHAKKSVGFAQEFALKWIQGESVSTLEIKGAEKFEQERMVEEIRIKIQELLQKNPKIEWRTITRKIWAIRNLWEEDKQNLKQWFEETSNSSWKSNIEKIIEKIENYRKNVTTTTWTEIRRKFNLARKSRDEQQFIQEALGM